MKMVLSLPKKFKVFDRFFTYNFSTSIGTTIYGMFNFEKEGKDPKIQRIRHVMRPSISYNVNPAFDQYYDTFELLTLMAQLLMRFDENNSLVLKDHYLAFQTARIQVLLECL